jgi:hypothetical protein
MHNRCVTEARTYERRPPLPAEAGRAIRAARLRLGWSIEYAAAQIGIGHSHLWYLENSRRALGDRTAERIIQGLHLRGQAVRVLRASAAPGWHTRNGKPLVAAYGRGNRAPRVRPVVTTHKGSCIEHMLAQRVPWKETG